MDAVSAEEKEREKVLLILLRAGSMASPKEFQDFFDKMFGD